MSDVNASQTDLMQVPQETTFASVGQFLRSRDLGPVPREASREVLGHALVSLDGAEHRDRRIAENPLFAPDALQRYETELLEPALREAFEELVPLADEDGRAPLNVPALATDLILNISLALIGIDRRTPEDRRFVFSCVEPLIAAHEVEWTPGDPTEAIARSIQTKDRLWREYLEPAYRRRQQALSEGEWTERPDLLSVLAAHRDTIDEETVSQECALYLVASVLTTSATITNTVELLLDWCETHPSDRELVLDESSDFLVRFVEEALRVRPPIKPLLLRVAKGDAVVGGCPVSAGQMVGANVGAAHADPQVYPDDAAAFDPTRSPAVQVRRTHYSFGDGPHLCIGKPLVIGDARAGTQGDAPTIVRALFAADVRNDPTRERRFAPTARQRYVEYPVTVRVRD